MGSPQHKRKIYGKSGMTMADHWYAYYKRGGITWSEFTSALRTKKIPNKYKK